MILHRFFLSALISALPLVAAAQSYKSILGDEFALFAALPTDDGGVFVAGEIEAKNEDGAFTKKLAYAALDPAASIKWNGECCPSYETAQLLGLEHGHDGDLHLAFRVKKTGQDEHFWYVAAVDQDGTPLWTVPFHDYTSRHALFQLHGMAPSRSDGIIVLTSPKAGRIAVTHIDPTGTALWSRSYQGTSGSLVTDQAGKSYVGTTEVTLGDSLADSSASIVLRKLTPGGDVLWRQPIDDDDPETNQTILDDLVLLDEDLLIGVGSVRSDEVVRGFVFALDGEGHLLWKKQVAPETGWGRLTSVAQLADGGFAAAGAIGPQGKELGMRQGWMVAFDDDGAPLWQMTGDADASFGDFVKVEPDQISLLVRRPEVAGQTKIGQPSQVAVEQYEIPGAESGDSSSGADARANATLVTAVQKMHEAEVLDPSEFGPAAQRYFLLSTADSLIRQLRDDFPESAAVTGLEDTDIEADLTALFTASGESFAARCGTDTVVDCLFSLSENSAALETEEKDRWNSLERVQQHHAEMGRLADALRLMEQMEDPTTQSRMRGRLAKGYAAAGQPAAAQALIASETKPTQRIRLMTIAAPGFHQQGETQQARELMGQAAQTLETVKKFADSPRALLARAHIKMGEYDDALALLEKIKRKFVLSSVAQRLVVASWLDGDRELAMRAWAHIETPSDVLQFLMSRTPELNAQADAERLRSLIEHVLAETKTQSTPSERVRALSYAIGLTAERPALMKMGPLLSEVISLRRQIPVDYADPALEQAYMNALAAAEDTRAIVDLAKRAEGSKQSDRSVFDGIVRLAGLGAFQEAQELYALLGDETFRAAADRQLGLAYARAGDLKAANDQFEKVEAFLNSPLGSGRALTAVRSYAEAGALDFAWQLMPKIEDQYSRVAAYMALSEAIENR